MKPIEIPTPKNKLEELCFPKLVKVTEMKNDRGINLTIYKTSSILDIPQEMLDYEKSSIETYIPHRATTRTGNIDLGTCDALVVRKWGEKECETVFSAILVKPFSKIDKAIYEEMMRRTFNKPKERLVLSFDNRREYPQGGIVGKGATQTRGEMVIQMNERDKEIFKKCRPGVTTEEWINISRSLNEEIDEQMKHLKTPSMNNEELLDEIRKAMETVLLTNNGKDLNFRPIKGTTKEKCYNVLGKIQTLLETNKVKTQ